MYFTDDKVKAVKHKQSLLVDLELTKHHYFNREMFMAIDPADIHWVLDNYKPLLARFGYDLLYEVWLDAIEGRETDEAVTTENIKQAMLFTRGIGNWGQYWAN